MAGYGSVDSLHDGSSVEGGAATGPPGGGAEFYGEGAGGSPGDSHPKSLFHWGWHNTVLAVLGFIVVAAIVAWFIQLPYYALTPGAAPEVSGLIKVPSSDHHAHKGSVLLVYVELTELRALYYPFFWLDSNAAIYPSSEILGSETTAQYATEGEIDMSTAQQAATVVALQQLGYKVPVVPLGALVYGIIPGTPAAAALQVGDVISEVDGIKVPSYLSLSTRLEALSPFETVHVVVSAYPAGKPHTVTFKLGVFRTTPGGYDCFPAGEGTRYKITEFVAKAGGKSWPLACMGIYPQGSGGPAVDGTAYRIGPLPVKVDLSSEGIVGPSGGAGLHAGAHGGARSGRSHRRAQGRGHRDDVDRRLGRRRRRGRPEDHRGARCGGKRVLRAAPGVHRRKGSRGFPAQGVRREHDWPGRADPGVTRGPYRPDRRELGVAS